MSNANVTLELIGAPTDVGASVRGALGLLQAGNVAGFEEECRGYR